MFQDSFVFFFACYEKLDFVFTAGYRAHGFASGWMRYWEEL